MLWANPNLLCCRDNDKNRSSKALKNWKDHLTLSHHRLNSPTGKILYTDTAFLHPYLQFQYVLSVVVRKNCYRLHSVTLPQSDFNVLHQVDEYSQTKGFRTLHAQPLDVSQRGNCIKCSCTVWRWAHHSLTRKRRNEFEILITLKLTVYLKRLWDEPGYCVLCSESDMGYTAQAP